LLMRIPIRNTTNSPGSSAATRSWMSMAMDLGQSA
jgi:hypothetical protein